MMSSKEALEGYDHGLQNINIGASNMGVGLGQNSLHPAQLRDLLCGHTQDSLVTHGMRMQFCFRACVHLNVTMSASPRIVVVPSVPACEYDSCQLNVHRGVIH